MQEWLREPRVRSETRNWGLGEGFESGALLPLPFCQKPHVLSALGPEVSFVPPTH